MKYAFVFKTPEMIGPSAYISRYDTTLKKYTSCKGIFQLIYMNSKIGRDKLWYEAPFEQNPEIGISKKLYDADLINLPEFGYTLITDCSETALYLRLGIEEVTHPRMKAKFSCGYKFEDKNLVELDQQIKELENLRTNRNKINDVRNQLNGTARSILYYKQSFDNSSRNNNAMNILIKNLDSNCDINQLEEYRKASIENASKYTSMIKDQENIALKKYQEAEESIQKKIENIRDILKNNHMAI